MQKEYLKLKTIAENYFKENNEINEKTLFDYLVQNEWKIYSNYDKACKLEDIKMELEELEVEYDDQLLYDILADYEDRLDDCDDWHFILNEIVKRWVGKDE